MLRKLFVLGVIGVLSNAGLALAQNAPSTDCDTLAGHPNDPQRKAPGIVTSKLNPVLAVPACETVVRQYPNDARLNFQLGRAYQKAGNFPLALGQYKKSAAQGYAPAQANLGTMYREGEGVAKDPQEAMKWYRLAIEKKYIFAELNLGSMYYAGEGVGKDHRQAAVWYRLAAEQGDAQAQTNLGLMYVRGDGVTSDDREAVKWYRQAAAQGSATAQSNLGTMYAMGRGVGQDFLRSHMWLSIAAPKLSGAELQEAIKNRSIIEKNLNPAQLAQAKEMARLCQARNLLNCD